MTNLTECEFRNDNLCMLTMLFRVGVDLRRGWCEKNCNPHNTKKQIAMLKKIGYEIPVAPEGVNLYDWTKRCIMINNIGLSKIKKHLQAEEHQQELLEQLPKGFQLADNLKNHLGQIASHYIKTRRIKVSDEHRKKRLAKCEKCPSDLMVVDDDGVMRCTHKSCGCYLNNPNNRPALGGKAEYEALTCDEGHWEKIEE